MDNFHTLSIFFDVKRKMAALILYQNRRYDFLFYLSHEHTAAQTTFFLFAARQQFYWIMIIIFCRNLFQNDILQFPNPVLYKTPYHKLR